MISGRFALELAPLALFFLSYSRFGISPRAA
jgi:hypothetical protein